MLSPCTACVHKIVERNEFRIIEKCESKKLQEDFIYDDLCYWHLCKNHTPNEKCLTCEFYEAPYCKSSYADCVKE